MATSRVAWNTGDDGQYAIYNQLYPVGYTAAQTFLTGAEGFLLSSVFVKLYRDATSTGTLTLELRSTSGSPAAPTETVLASGTLARSGITTVSPGAAYEITMSEYTLLANTTYALVTYNSSAVSTYWRQDSSSGYADGRRWVRELGGSWVSSTTNDFMFDVWGNDAVTYAELEGLIAGVGSIAGTLTTYAYADLVGSITGAGSITGILSRKYLVPSRLGGKTRLVVCGNDQLWYEDS